MNTITIQQPDQPEQHVPVYYLALEGTKVKVSEECKHSLMQASNNIINVQARNDANAILWFLSFGPALCKTLSQYEEQANIQEKINEQQTSAGNEQIESGKPNEGEIIAGIESDPTGNAEGIAVQ